MGLRHPCFFHLWYVQFGVCKLYGKSEYSEGYLNKEPITLTKNSVPIFDNATVWLELKTEKKIDFGTHTFFVGEIINCKTLTPEERVAYMGDTRMKYGGVPRGGHE